MKLQFQNELPENRFNFFNYYLKGLLWISLGIYFIFTIWRMWFFLSFVDSSLSSVSNFEIMRGFMLGSRYDSASIAYIIIIPFLVSIVQLIICPLGLSKYINCKNIFDERWPKQGKINDEGGY